MNSRQISAADLKPGMTVVEQHGSKTMRFRVVDAVPRHVGTEIHVSVMDQKNSHLLWRYESFAPVQVAA